MNIGVIIGSIIFLVGLIGVGSRFIPGLKTDNRIEEVAELVIEQETGYKIDLSPDDGDPDDISEIILSDMKPSNDSLDYVKTGTSSSTSKETR